jgi:hypothetical protein
MSQVITALDASNIFRGLSLYFSGKYDWFRYGPMKASLGKGSNFFYVLSRKYNRPEYMDLCISTMSETPRLWVADLVEDQADAVRMEYVAWLESMTYRLEQQLVERLESIDGNPLDYFTPIDGYHPQMLKDYQSGKLSLLALVAIDQAIRFSPMWTRRMPNDLIWNKVATKMAKLKPFVESRLPTGLDAVVKKAIKNVQVYA